MSRENQRESKSSLWMRTVRTDHADVFAAVFVAIVLGSLYLKTLLPGIHDWGDATKAQFLGRVLGIGHATGEPVYILLTHIWSYLPIGELAWRINFFSAVCAVGTCVFLYCTARLLGSRRSSAILAALLLGVTPTLWSQAVSAEVYTLNSLFFSAVIHSLLLWQASHKMQPLYRAVALYALALGGHMTIIFLFPACLFLGLRERPSLFRDKKFILFSLLCAGLIFSLYPLYFFWRTYARAVFLENQFTQWNQVWTFMTGGPFKRKMFHYSWKILLGKVVPDSTAFFISEFNFFIILAIAGFVKLKSQRIRFFLTLIGVAYFIWNLNYDIFDIRVYYIPLFYLTALFTGFGMDALLDALKTDWSKVLGASFLFGGIRLWTCLNFEATDQSKNTELYNKIRAVIKKEEKNTLFAVYFGPNYGEQMGFYYFLEGLGEGKKRNMHVSGYLFSGQIYAYLTRGAELKDSHTGQPLPKGLRVVAFGAMVDGLMRYGLLAKPVGEGFFEMQINPLQTSEQSETGSLLFPNSDFETGTLSNWQMSGEAFKFQPTLGDNPSFRERLEGSGVQGRFWIGTHEHRQKAGEKLGGIQGDAPMGTLLSTPFNIRADMIKFKIGGGDGSKNTAVALRVEGQPVLVETSWGMQLNSEYMHDVLWDVHQWKGKTGAIEVRDWRPGHWGHINADDFRYAKASR